MPRPRVDAFHALADPSRRHILSMLIKNSMTINSLAENFDMSRPAVSKHIKVLQMNGFISISVQGRERYCSLKYDGFADLQKWLDYFDGFWRSRLQRLGALLNEDKLKKD